VAAKGPAEWGSTIIADSLVRVVPGRVAEVVIERAEVRNVLNTATVAQLTDAFRRLAAERGTQAILLYGAGERAFCAGADLREILAARAPDAARAYFGGLGDLFELMARVPQPIVAAVRGHALGGGCGLAVAADVTIAADDAVFGLPEIRVGLFPMVVLGPILRCVSRKTVVELAMTGGSLPAEAAREAGFCSRVVPSAALLEEARAVANAIASYSPAILALGKAGLRGTDAMPLGAQLGYLRDLSAMVALLEDSREGMTAFLEKRPPAWRGA
jgi:enoyl-CoA hydratase/carnithine racemase